MAHSRVVLDRFADAQDAYRRRELRQAQYDEGDIVMADVLVNLHGAEHRDRRRAENQLFRRSVFEYYERELFPAVIDDVLAPCFAAGRAELVHLGHRMMLHIAARVAGIDLDPADLTAAERLQDHLELFTEALTLAQSKLDKDKRKAAIGAAMAAWTEEFYLPSRLRRERLRRERLRPEGLRCEGLRAGPAAGSQLRDVLSVLVDHQTELGLPDDVVRRETAFFLLVAAHTSATAFVRSVHHILDWLSAHSGDIERLRTEPFLVQRCVHETIRLNPSSTVGMRRSTADVTLRSGIKIPADSEVIIDLRSVNRDVDVFGADAADFDPDRSIPASVPPYGLSFAAGMHVCIGQDLAAGVVDRSGEAAADTHLFGLVALAVRRLLDADVRLDPEDQPRRDSTTERVYWARYPVLLT